MKKTLLLVPGIFMLAIIAAPAATVAAAPADPSHGRERENNFRLRGEGTCQSNGTFRIVWRAINKDDDRLKIVFSSNEDVVPDNTRIPAQGAKEFVQVADGTKVATYNLALKARFIDKDDMDRERETEWARDSVHLRAACAQPTAAQPTKPTVLAAQVTAVPTGGVKAGGGAMASGLGAVVGLTSSLAVASLGLRRLSRF